VSGRDARSLAGRPLYRPFEALLSLADGEFLPACEELSEVVAKRVPGLVSGAGRPIRFVSPERAGQDGYEQRIFDTGEVVTRPNDWHDFFNALVWAVYPRTKLATNARHLLEIGRRGGDRRRGAVRDALTQFDECGVVVCTSVEELAAGLLAHEWESVLWSRRATLAAHMDFRVIGHASLDLLREPFVGLCGKALYRLVDPAWFALSCDARSADVDAWLAGTIADESRFCSPREFSPLPLLGIPGVVAENQDQAYYWDIRQFRPRPRRTVPPD